MRNMSFMLTTEQVKKKQKTVTRRNGWKNIKVGEQIRAVKKCMGLKKGEKMESLGIIRVISKRREPLNELSRAPDYGEREVAREGFIHLRPEEFIQMYCAHNKCKPSDSITRIEFEYV
jgi:hypothetical protein